MQSLYGEVGSDISHVFVLYFSSLAVGTKFGYKLFSLSSVEKLDQIYDNGEIHVYISHIPVPKADRLL